MSLDSLTDEERATIAAAVSTLRTIEDHFRLRDRANARLYLAGVRYSPITKLAARSATALSRLFDGEGELTDNESTEEQVDQMSEESEPAQD